MEALRRRPSRPGPSRSTRSARTVCTRRATATSTTGRTTRSTSAGTRRAARTATDGWRPCATTAGQIVTYHGRVAFTVFTASDGGHTEDLRRAVGNPALVLSRTSPGSATQVRTRPRTRGPIGAVDSPRRRSRAALAPYTGSIGTVQGFGAIDRGVSGRIENAVVRGVGGDATVTGAELRSALVLARRSRVGRRRQERARRHPHQVRRPDVRARAAHHRPPRCFPGGSRQRFQTGAIYRNDRRRHGVAEGAGLRRVPRASAARPGRWGCPIVDPVTVGSSARRDVRRDAAGRFRARAGLLEGRCRRVRAMGRRAGVVPRRMAGSSGRLGFPTSRVVQRRSGSASATFEHGSITCARGSCHVAASTLIRR